VAEGSASTTTWHAGQVSFEQATGEIQALDINRSARWVPYLLESQVSRNPGDIAKVLGSTKAAIETRTAIRRW